MASKGAREGGRVGLMFRFWRREDERMGLASSSFLFIPNPMTANPSPSPSAYSFPGPCFFLLSFPAMANSSSSEGKWLIQLEHKSSIRPLRGRVAA